MGIYRGANYHGILRLREIYELNENSHNLDRTVWEQLKICAVKGLDQHKC